MTMTPAVLDLTALRNGLPGVSPALGTAHLEACAVCLKDHRPGISLSVKGAFESSFILKWDQLVTEQMLRSWNDAEFATEWAACGIAFLLVQPFTGYTIVRQSRRGTGFDYWLGSAEPETLLVQDKAQLEISGI